MSKRGLGTRLSLGALMLCCVGVLAGCASPDVLPRGESAYALIGDPDKGPVPVADYKISPSDTISITVFQEPDLSLKEAVVEASGHISMPLIGSVPAAGLTTTQLASDLEQRLGARYLEKPQVSVIVNVAVSQQVTVEGNVLQPGSYPMGGRMTLLRALALAHGPTRVAALDEVVVFRMVGGKRMGALFDVNAIRKGQASDPQIEGNDMVVVGFNAVKGAYRDFLQTAPFLNVFRNF